MSAEKVSIEEAAVRLAELVERVREGREVIIAEDDTPMARLIPIQAGASARSFGGYEGRVRIREDFDVELPAEFWLGKQTG